MKFKRKILTLLTIALVGLFAVRVAMAVDAAMSDTGHLGNDQWHIQTDGDMVPQADSSQDIGASGGEVDNIYVDSLWLGTVEKTSWGSVVSPWTDYTGYTALTDGSLDTIMWDDGDITLGGGTATDVLMIWNSDSNDYYIGTYDADNELQLGYGSALDTQNLITLTSALLIRLFDGTAADSQLVWDGNGYDFHIGIDDAGGEEADLFVIGRGAAAGTNPAISIGKSSGMVYMDAITSAGSADFDIGESGVTDVTVTTDGGAIILDGTITLTDSEVISNATDDTVRIASGDLDTVLEVYTPYDTTGDATLKLSADLGDEVGEQWTITSTGASTDLVIGCDDSSSGTPITTFTIADDGIVTSINYIDNKIEDSGTNNIADVAMFTHTSTSTPAASLGVGLVFNLEDASGNAAEQMGSIDVLHGSTPTNGAEDADMVVYLESAGTEREVLRIDTDTGATGGNVLEFTSWTTETDGVVDVLQLTLDNTADTATDDFGAGISIVLEQEDSGTPVEHASIDVVLTDAGTAAEDSDIIFGQSIGGSAVATTVTFDADAGIDMSGTGYDLIFPGDEKIDNDTANTLTVRSNDEATTLTIMGFTDKAAKLILDSDLGADAADTWTLEAEDGGNLTLDNSTTEILEITSAGSLQLDGDLSIDGGDLDTDDTYLKILSASTQYHKYHYYPIAYVGATQARVGGGAEPLLCAGLAAGVDEIGSTQGYVTMTEESDYLRFRFAMPETMIDTGTVTDFVIQFYMDEQATLDAVTYDVNIYEFGATTAILTDTITIAHNATAGWKSLTSNSTGIGDETSLDADDILVVTLSPQIAGMYDQQTAKIYGCRIKYSTGIEATQ